jgi:hypothetical protein
MPVPLLVNTGEDETFSNENVPQEYYVTTTDKNIILTYNIFL